MSKKKKAAMVAVIGSGIGLSEEALDRRERLLSRQKDKNCSPMEDNLRRLREAEYPVHRRTGGCNRW